MPQLKVGCIRVTHPFATRRLPEGTVTVRLACVKPAASVHPEPGSNSSLYSLTIYEKAVPLYRLYSYAVLARFTQKKLLSLGFNELRSILGERMQIYKSFFTYKPSQQKFCTSSAF